MSLKRGVSLLRDFLCLEDRGTFFFYRFFLTWTKSHPIFYGKSLLYGHFVFRARTFFLTKKVSNSDSSLIPSPVGFIHRPV